MWLYIFPLAILLFFGYKFISDLSSVASPFVALEKGITFFVGIALAWLALRIVGMIRDNNSGV